MSKSRDAFRTISEVSDLLDTPAHVLRFWESKFSQVKPVKRAGGRRYYRPGDVNLLAGIKTLLHEDGMTIKGAQKMLRDRGVKDIGKLGEDSLAVAQTSDDTDVIDHVDVPVSGPADQAPSDAAPAEDSVEAWTLPAVAQQDDAPEVPEIRSKAGNVDPAPELAAEPETPQSATADPADEEPSLPAPDGPQEDAAASAADESSIQEDAAAAQADRPAPDLPDDANLVDAPSGPGLAAQNIVPLTFEQTGPAQPIDAERAASDLPSGEDLGEPDLPDAAPPTETEPAQTTAADGPTDKAQDIPPDTVAPSDLASEDTPPGPQTSEPEPTAARALPDVPADPADTDSRAPARLFHLLRQTEPDALSRRAADIAPLVARMRALRARIHPR